MECRNLDITLISVGGLKSLTKNNISVVWRSGGKKLQTRFLKNTGSSEIPVNFPMKFIIDEATALKGDLSLFIKFKTVKWMFFSKTLGKGQVRVPIKNLIEGITEEGKESQLVSCQVVNQKAKPVASLTFSYKFGKKFPLKGANSDSKLKKNSSGSGTNPLAARVLVTDLAAHDGDYCDCVCFCGGGSCRLTVW